GVTASDLVEKFQNRSVGVGAYRSSWRTSYHRRIELQTSSAVSAYVNKSTSSRSITPSSARNRASNAFFQNRSPTSTTGIGSIVRVWISVSVSKSSSKVP